MDYNKRDQIIWNENYNEKEYAGGIRKFKIYANQLERLIEEGYAKLESQHNCSPTIERFLDFINEYGGYKAIGFAYSKRRNEKYIAIEGIEKNDMTKATIEEIKDFIYTFRHADEFDFEELSCWYD